MRSSLKRYGYYLSDLFEKPEQKISRIKNQMKFHNLISIDFMFSSENWWKCLNVILSFCVVKMHKLTQIKSLNIKLNFCWFFERHENICFWRKPLFFVCLKSCKEKTCLIFFSQKVIVWILTLLISQSDDKDTINLIKALNISFYGFSIITGYWRPNSSCLLYWFNFSLKFNFGFLF